MVFVTYNNLEDYLSPRVSDQSYQTGQPEEKVDMAQDNVIQINDIDTFETEQKKHAGDVESIVNTNIISASINDHKNTIPLMEPVVFTLQHKQVWNSFRLLYIDTNNE